MLNPLGNIASPQSRTCCTSVALDAARKRYEPRHSRCVDDSLCPRRRKGCACRSDSNGRASCRRIYRQPSIAGESEAINLPLKLSIRAGLETDKLSKESTWQPVAEALAIEFWCINMSSRMTAEATIW